MRVIESAIVETAQEREKKQGVLSTFGDPGKICFLDIETTGFSRTYDTIYLIGLVYYTNDTVMARQYLASRRQDEALLLKEALEFLSGFDTLITYNGDMFDLPFIRERARLLRQWTPEAAGKADLVRSVDLMRRYRRHQKFFGWPNMKLKTVESCLGIGREDPFDGGQLIDVFDEYEKTQDPRLEKTLLLHNYEDIVNLRDLLKVDELLGILEKGHPLMARLRGSTVVFAWNSQMPVSLEARVPFEAKAGPGSPSFLLRMEAGLDEIQIVLPEAEDAGQLKYYLSDPGNYYYLPGTSEIVHKSLSFDIPASERRPARAAQCYLKAPEDIYLEVPKEAFTDRSTDKSTDPSADRSVAIFKDSLKSKRHFVRKSDLFRFFEKADPQEIGSFSKTFLDRI